MSRIQKVWTVTVRHKIMTDQTASDKKQKIEGAAQK
jgi:hypothetical protein